MTTPLQQAAQNMLKSITEDAWLDAYEELRKALEAEIAQAVEPVAYADIADNGNIRIWTKFATCENIKDLKPLYLHPPQSQATTPVPEGCVLVPIVPTAAMVASTWDDNFSGVSENAHNRRIYKAMLAAAQGEKP